MTENKRQQVLAFVQTIVAVLVGGVISYFTIGAQAHLQARTEQTTAAYAAYVEAVTEFAHAVAAKKIERSTAQRMAAAKGRIAIYGTPEVITSLPVVGSIHDENVKNMLVSAIVEMRQDVGEETVDRDALFRLLFGNNPEDAM